MISSCIIYSFIHFVVTYYTTNITIISILFIYLFIFAWLWNNISQYFEKAQSLGANVMKLEHQQEMREVRPLIFKTDTFRLIRLLIISHVYFELLFAYF